MQTFRRIHAPLLLVLTAIACASVMHAQQPPVIDLTVLKNAGTSKDSLPGSWLTYGKSQTEQRYSSLKQIDASNVTRLGLAWSYVVGSGGYGQEGTPLVWNNTIYGITTWSVVYALDGRTGKEIWRWDPEVNQATTRGITANLGTGRNSVLEVVKAYERASGRPVPYQMVARRPGDIAASYADPTLANELLGWSSRHDLNPMCEDSWRWQSMNPKGFAA